VSGIFDRWTCRDAACKLVRDKTFRFTKRQKGSYTSTQPRVKRVVTKTFTILTSSAAAAASADDDKLRNFGTFIANTLRNYLPRTRNKVQHKISHIFAADQGLFDVPYSVSTLSPASHVSFPTTLSSAAGSEYVILSYLMCL